MDVVEKKHSIKDVDFPYMPSFLSFREGPAIISAFRSLKTRPDLLMIDGCGINHPRSAGLATHIGVALDMATIGVAKKLLCGTVETPINIGEYSLIILYGQYVGALLLSKKGCNPIIIAPGHKVSLNSTIDIVRHCLRGQKLPDPIRIAHKYVGDITVHPKVDTNHRIQTSKLAKVSLKINPRNTRNPPEHEFRIQFMGSEGALGLREMYRLRGEIEHGFSTLKLHFGLEEFHVRGRQAVKVHVFLSLMLRGRTILIL